RYLNPRTAVTLSKFAATQIGFNYLGQLGDGQVAGGIGGGADPATPLPYALALNAVTETHVDGPRLAATWIWPGELLTEEAVADVARAWFDALAALVAHDEAGTGGALVPADLPLVSLPQAEIDRLAADQPGLVDVLPLAPAQEGLLFHAEYDQSTEDVYITRMAMDVHGDLDVAALRAAVRGLLDRHANLRAGFRYTEAGQPVQLIPAAVDLPWREIDLRHLDAVEQAAGLDRLLVAERAHRFALDRPPLLRFTLIELGDNTRRLLFAAHRLLLDGWSVQVLAGELFALYGGVALPPVTPYRDYLAWLAGQDQPAAADAWRHALAGLTEPTLVAPAAAGRPPVLPDRIVVNLPEPLAAGVAA